MGFMYIVRCADGALYVGSTRSLDKRIWEHNNGYGAAFTRRRLPVELVYYEEYDDNGTAVGRERQVQNWSRAKRLALVEQRCMTSRPPRESKAPASDDMST